MPDDEEGARERNDSGREPRRPRRRAPQVKPRPGGDGDDPPPPPPTPPPWRTLTDPPRV